MFGYIQIQKSELLVREYEAYKSVYCGLCRQMGKDFSVLTRMTLSYDCAFYAMFLLSQRRSCKGFKDGRCVCNPLKKCKFALDESDCYSQAAAFSVISGYYKLKDDIEDGGFFKKILCYFALPFFSHWRKKAAKNYSEIEKCVNDMMSAQNEAEHLDNCSIDRAAHPTAEMLATLFSLEAKNDSESRVFKEFGYHIGRWIYLIDAADDLEKDKKNGNFNPFLKNNDDSIDKDYIGAVLNQSLARAYDAYNLIDIKDFKGIFDNVMLFGLPSVQNKVTAKSTEVNNEQSL